MKPKQLRILALLSLGVGLGAVLAGPPLAQSAESQSQAPEKPIATAQSERPSKVTLENTEVRHLRSEILDREFRLLIARPFGMPTGPDGTYPVLYLLDGQMAFPLVRQVVMSLQSGFEMPPVLIVGITPAGGMREAMMFRTRDYTPTPDPVFTSFAARWGESTPGEDGSGGGPDFLRFIREELKPFVEASYPVDPADATLFGTSFGGLFATYTLLHHPDTFQRYIMSSPSLWWGKRVSFEFEEQYAAEHDDLSARVFVAAGGHETSEQDEAQLALLPEQMRRPMLELQEALDGDMQMLEVVEPFVEKLSSRGYPSLDLTLHIFPGETHGSVPPMSISRGLRTVFSSD